jgi:hypothetical protein
LTFRRGALTWTFSLVIFSASISSKAAVVHVSVVAVVSVSVTDAPRGS